MFIIHTPFRISFFGGGTDYLEWFQHHKGGFISGSCQWGTHIIAKPRPVGGYSVTMQNIWIGESLSLCPVTHIKAVFEKFPIPPMDIIISADLPTGSGLGSSGSFIVSLLVLAHEARGEYYTKKQIAQEAFDIEYNTLKEFVGIQDQLSVSYGGLLHVLLSKGNIETLDVLPMGQLNHYLCMVYTGKRRHSSVVSQQNLKKMEKKLDFYKQIYQCIEQAKTAIIKEDYKEFGTILDYTWQLKQNISDHMNIKEIQDVYNQGKSFGAWGGKLMGAGGGGFVLFFAPLTTQILLSKFYHHYFIPIRLMSVGYAVKKIL